MNPILKRVITGLVVGAIFITAVLLFPIWLYPWVMSVFIALALWEYITLLKQKLNASSPKRHYLWLFGLLVIAGGLWAIPLIAAKWGNVIVLYVLMMIKLSDTGGFTFGLTSAKFMKGGNHKMCPTISPNKSWEGLLGSIVFSCLVSLIFMFWTPFGLGKSLLLGVVAALIGTLGDLIESRFKRWVGVKDSSTMKLTNGMGGFLDMFDSLLLAPMVILALM